MLARSLERIQTRASCSTRDVVISLSVLLDGCRCWSFSERSQLLPLSMRPNASAVPCVLHDMKCACCRSDDLNELRKTRSQIDLQLRPFMRQGMCNSALRFHLLHLTPARCVSCTHSHGGSLWRGTQLPREFELHTAKLQTRRRGYNYRPANAESCVYHGDVRRLR